MSHDIIDDREFWNRLEYAASHWLQSSNEKSLRRLWIDGFLPEHAAGTKFGIDVTGIAWVGSEGRVQHPYRFIVSVSQKMAHRRKRDISIEQLVVDSAQQTLEMQIDVEEGVA